jgi:hypothetical protein
MWSKSLQQSTPAFYHHPGKPAYLSLCVYKELMEEYFAHSILGVIHENTKNHVMAIYNLRNN